MNSLSTCFAHTVDAVQLQKLPNYKLFNDAFVCLIHCMSCIILNFVPATCNCTASTVSPMCLDSFKTRLTERFCSITADSNEGNSAADLRFQNKS